MINPEIHSYTPDELLDLGEIEYEEYWNEVHLQKAACLERTGRSHIDVMPSQFDADDRWKELQKQIGIQDKDNETNSKSNL